MRADPGHLLTGVGVGEEVAGRPVIDVGMEEAPVIEVLPTGDAHHDEGLYEQPNMEAPVDVQEIVEASRKFQSPEGNVPLADRNDQRHNAQEQPGGEQQTPPAAEPGPGRGPHLPDDADGPEDQEYDFIEREVDEVKVEGAKVEIASETIEEEARTENPPVRIGINLTAPVDSAVIEIVVEPGDKSPA